MTVEASSSGGILWCELVVQRGTQRLDYENYEVTKAVINEARA